MNKLLTFGGGQPFTTQDVAFLQENFNSAISNLISSLCSGKDCILTGIRAGDYQVGADPGAVFIKGNIYILDKETPYTSGTSYYLCIRQDEKEKRTFRDFSEHNVYLVDNAYMSDTPSDISIDLRSANTLAEILVIGNGLFYDLGPELPERVTGNVYHIESDYKAIDSKMIVDLKKSSDDDNLLWSTAFRDPAVYYGLTVYNRQAYIVEGNRGEGRVYNLDGTPYNGPIHIYNLKLR